MKIPIDIESGDISQALGIDPKRAMELAAYMRKVEKSYQKKLKVGEDYKGGYILQEFLKEAKNDIEVILVSWRAGASFTEMDERNTNEHPIVKVLHAGKKGPIEVLKNKIDKL